MSRSAVRRRSLRAVAAAAAVLAVLASSAGPARAVSTGQTSVVTANPAGWTPQVLDGAVYAVALIGSRVVIGGTFTQVQAGGKTYARRYLAAFDAHTGAMDTGFTPKLDGPVNALATDGRGIVVGGEFNTVNGTAWKGLARLLPDGTRDPGFRAQLDNGLLNAAVIRLGRLYVGGKFTGISGTKRTNLAAMNARTGALDPLNLPATGPRVPGSSTGVQTLDVSPDGTRMVLSGNFTHLAGLVRNQLAVVDLTRRAVAPWSTQVFVPPCDSTKYWSYVRDIEFSPDGTWFVVVTTGGPYPGTLCDTATRWETARSGANQQPTWADASGGDTLSAVAVTGAAVYVGGHMRWMNNWGGKDAAVTGAVPRSGLAALDPVSGAPLQWNPGRRDRGVGVFDLVATPDGLWMAHDTNYVADELHERLAYFPLAGGTANPPVVPVDVPSFVYTAAGSTLTARVFSGSRFGAAKALPSTTSVPWKSAAGAFMLNGRVYYATSGGTLSSVPFDGTRTGTPVQTANPASLLQGVTALAFSAGRVLYTTGDGRLYARAFSAESGLVGAQRITIASSGYSGVRALFVAGGRLYVVRSDGRLYPAGSSRPVSGPGVDGVSWAVTVAFPRSSPADRYERVAGTDRVATSLQASARAFVPGSAGAVVLARSDVFADGLAGAPLAAARNAPLLLTEPKALDSRTAAEMVRVLPPGATVYLLGGTAALSAGVEAAVRGLGYPVQRLAGPDRFGTALAIAGRLPGASQVLLATGRDFPDALGAGAAAGAADGVVLLTDGTRLPTTVGRYLDAHPGLTVWGIGGPAVRAAGARITSAGRKLVGANRYATAVAVATAFFPSPSQVALATGASFPDGLSGGAFAARAGIPLLLTGATTPTVATTDYLRQRAATIRSGLVFGGTAVVRPAVVDAAAEASG